MGEDTKPTRPVDASVERRLALLVDAVEEYAIFLLAPDGTVMTWNSGAKRIKGYAAEEVLGRHFSIFYIPDDISANKPQHELDEAVERGQARDEGWRVRKDGSKFWANVVITALHDETGQLSGFAKVTRDETDRKKAEEQVRQLELLADRERIAGELHEVIVHQIFEAGLAIEGALQLVTEPLAIKRIQGAVELLDRTLREIRQVVLGLNSEPES